MRNLYAIFIFMVLSACARQTDEAAAICKIDINDYQKDTASVAECIELNFLPGSSRARLEKFLAQSDFEVSCSQQMPIECDGLYRVKDMKNHHYISVSYISNDGQIVQSIGSMGQ